MHLLLQQDQITICPTATLVDNPTSPLIYVTGSLPSHVAVRAFLIQSFSLNNQGQLSVDSANLPMPQ